MSKKRLQHSPDLKAQFDCETLEGIEPSHAIAAKCQVYPVQLSHWKKEAAERLPEVFARKADRDAQETAGRKKELDLPKTKLALPSVEKRRRMIKQQHPALAINIQRELLGLARAIYYHQPEPESDANLRVIRVIAETYLA